MRYAVGAAWGLIALGLVWLVPAFHNVQLELLVLFAAVVVTTWTQGWRAGLLTTGLTTWGFLLMCLFRAMEPGPLSLQVTVFIVLSLLLLGVAVIREQSLEMALTSEIQLRAILENSLDPIAVSRAGIHQYVNPAYLRMFGYRSTDELVGKSVLQVIAEDERQSIERRIELRAQGEPVENSYETRGVRMDGSHVEMEVHVSTYILNGQTLSLVILRDITGRKRAMQEKEHLIVELRGALSKVKQLKGLLPTCSSCHKIRDQDGEWHEMETYISEHSDAGFSHGFCPECARRLYPEVFESLHRPRLAPRE